MRVQEKLKHSFSVFFKDQHFSRKGTAQITHPVLYYSFIVVCTVGYICNTMAFLLQYTVEHINVQDMCFELVQVAQTER